MLMLENERYQVREGGAVALGAMAELADRALESLEKKLKDREPRVSCAVLNALSAPGKHATSKSKSIRDCMVDKVRFVT